MKQQINWLGWGVATTLVLLSGALAWAWFTPQGQIKNAHWQPPAPIKADITALLPVAAPAKASGGEREEDRWMLQMQERPLFALSRRPPPPPPPPKKPEVDETEQDQWSQAKVLGLFEGSASGVIVQYAGKEQRLLMNQSLGGWKLSRVLERGIELERGDRTRQLSLTKAALDKAPPSVAASRVPGAAPSNAAEEARKAEAQKLQSGQAAAPSPPRRRASLGGGTVE